jgi:hypothetical protein
MTSRSKFGRRGWSGIAVGALVVVLAGCGSQAAKVDVKRTVPPSPRKVVLASVRATAAAKSARLSMKMTADIGEKENLTITAAGVTDIATGDCAISMNFGALFGGSGAMEIRVVDRVGYLKMPKALEMFAGGKWLKMPDLGAANGELPGVGESDPSKFLAYLETVSNGVTKVGAERIRGVETTHYRAVLDLGKAVERPDIPPSLRDDLRKVLRESKGLSALPADVWIDSDGLARRMAFVLDLGKLAGSDAPEGAPLTKMKMTMSMDLYDFGVPVNVVAPPPSETTEFPSFGPSGPSGAGLGLGEGKPNNA